MLTIHTTGNWQRGMLHVTRVPSRRRIIPEIEQRIDAAWREAKQKLGWRLFDGPMCRLESWRASPGRLDLELSETSYRIFYGTNLSRPRLPANVGPEVMANPVGVSSALETRDGFLLYGRRNARVAYYPDRVHPFAGALEQKDLSDVFGAVEREFHEELSLDPTDIESIRCLGIVQDNAILHPELIFHARAHLMREQIERQVHDEEHRGSLAIEARRESIEQALANATEFTPVAISALLLFGNQMFGNEWLTQASQPFAS